VKKESNYKNEPSIVVNKNPRKNFSKYIIALSIPLAIFILFFAKIFQISPYKRATTMG